VRVDGGAQILDDEVAVGARRNPHIAVPHEPLNAVNVHSSAEQLGCESVAQVVEPHRDVNCFGPQHSPARGNERTPATIRSLHAIRTVSALVVGGADGVFAPAAAMLVALDNAGAGQGVSQNFLRVRFSRALRAIRSRKQQGAWCVLKLVLNPGPKRRRERQNRRVSALRRISVVRTRHGHGSPCEIHVGLSEREELSLAQPQGGTASKQRSPLLGNLL